MTENKEKEMFLFDIDTVTDWKKEWQNMPEFVQEDLKPIQSIVVHFEKQEDLDRFSKLVEQNITSDTKSIWYPKPDLEEILKIRYVDES